MKPPLVLDGEYAITDEVTFSVQYAEDISLDEEENVYGVNVKIGPDEYELAAFMPESVLLRALNSQDVLYMRKVALEKQLEEINSQLEMANTTQISMG